MWRSMGWLAACSSADPLCPLLSRALPCCTMVCRQRYARIAPGLGGGLSFRKPHGCGSLLDGELLWAFAHLPLVREGRRGAGRGEARGREARGVCGKGTWVQTVCTCMLQGLKLSLGGVRGAGAPRGWLGRAVRDVLHTVLCAPCCAACAPTTGGAGVPRGGGGRACAAAA